MFSYNLNFNYMILFLLFFLFFFNDTATTEIYTSFPTRRSSDLTRTKESNTYASSKVANLGCAMKVTWWDSQDAPSTDQDLL